MGIRIEQYDKGEVVYIAIDPDGVWAKSKFPDALVTVDCNARGKTIGIELIGPAARALTTSLAHALDDFKPLDDREEVKESFKAIVV